MDVFDSRLLIEEDGPGYWRVARVLTYKGNTDTFVIPVGFRTDLASVPRIFWVVLPPFGAYQRAAVIHDFLCRQPDVSYKDADGIFRRILLEEGVPPRTAQVLYLGVRTGHRVLKLGPDKRGPR